MCGIRMHDYVYLLTDIKSDMKNIGSLRLKCDCQQLNFVIRVGMLK